MAHALLLLAALLLALVDSPPPSADTIVEGQLGAELDDYVNRCATFGFSGAVLVAKDGKVILCKGYGLADRAKRRAVTPDTRFEIASTSKQFTAAAILHLETVGRLSVTDSIAKHLPNVPEKHACVTIHHLLSHTAGFSRMGPTGGGPDLEQGVQGYLRADRGAAPGERHEYYNGGYALLAAIVERASGVPFTEYCRKHLFEPAGMTRTTFCQDRKAPSASLAQGYEGERDAGAATAHSFGWEYRGMGGVVTSVLDLHKWDRALRTEKILPKSAIERMYTPVLENYGYGWYILESPRKTRWISHGGDVAGFGTDFHRYPEEDAVVIVLANRDGVRWQVGYSLKAMLFGEKSTIAPPPKVIAVTPAELQRFEGRYELDDGSAFVVRSSDDVLMVGVEGQSAIAILSGQDPAAADALTKERETAEAMFGGLVKGDVSAIRDGLAPHLDFIRGYWPDQLRTKLWPQQIEKWGAFRSWKLIGARKDAHTGLAHVWI